MSVTIAITGVSGKLGSLILTRLRTRKPDQIVIALVRSPERADLAAEVRHFDYNQGDTLAPALVGVDTLMLVSSSEVGQRERQHRAVIAAARDAGVGHIVYTSLLHADTSSLALAGEHLVTEAALREAGIAHTILRNGWYTENYTASVPAAVANNAFIGSARDGRIASAARLDYAEAAAVVLADGGHDRQVYELAGDDAYQLSDLAAELSRQVGHEIPYVDMPERDYAAVLAGAGFPAPLADAYASYDVSAAEGALFDGGRQLSRLIGRPTTPLGTSIAEALSPSA